MTSFIAGSGSGRSASVIPAVPAAWSHTTIAFIGPLSVSGLTTPEHAVGQRARGRPAPGFLDTSGSGTSGRLSHDVPEPVGRVDRQQYPNESAAASIARPDVTDEPSAPNPAVP